MISTKMNEGKHKKWFYKKYIYIFAMEYIVTKIQLRVLRWKTVLKKYDL